MNHIGNRHEYFLRKILFESLDGLRFASIVAVIWHHAGPIGMGWHGLDMGYLGVDLFFVISGFLITTLLLREHDKSHNISLRNFYIRRTLRIFPLYYSVILILTVLYIFIRPDSKTGVKFLVELPYYITYTANLVPVSFAIVWSLAAEEQFYLLWPAIEKYLKKYAIIVLAGLLIVNQFINFPQGKELISRILGSDDWTQLSIWQVTFTPILMGVGAAHMLHSGRGFDCLRWIAASPWAPIGWLLAIVGLITVFSGDVSGLPRLMLHIGMTFLVISCVWQENHVLKPILTFAPIKHIGKISYGMYLFHIHAILAAQFFMSATGITGYIWLFSISLLFTTIAADLSFRLFESRFLRMKEKYSMVDHTKRL